MMIDSPEDIERCEGKDRVKLHLTIPYEKASGTDKHDGSQDDKGIVKEMGVPDFAVDMSKKMFHVQ